jgi:hypothetical protein
MQRPVEEIGVGPAQFAGEQQRFLVDGQATQAVGEGLPQDAARRERNLALAPIQAQFPDRGIREPDAFGIGDGARRARFRKNPKPYPSIRPAGTRCPRKMVRSQAGPRAPAK